MCDIAEQKKVLIEKLLESGSLKFGEFVLKSGLKSNHYVNLREISMNRDLFALVRDMIIEMMSDWPIVKNKKHKLAVVGVPYGAVPLAAVVADKASLAYYPVRKEVKSYGLKQDQDSYNDYRFILIEDVMSTGSSIIETIEKMPAKVVTDVIVIVSREQGGLENIFTSYPNVRVHSLLKSSEILNFHSESDLQ